MIFKNYLESEAESALDSARSSYAPYALTFSKIQVESCHFSTAPLLGCSCWNKALAPTDQKPWHSLGGGTRIGAGAFVLA